MSRKIELAELVDVTQIEIFDEPPQVYGVSTDDNKMYTLILIGKASNIQSSYRNLIIDIEKICREWSYDL